jgi:hypothetical protein
VLIAMRAWRMTFPLVRSDCAPGGIRTPDLLIRSYPLLYVVLTSVFPGRRRALCKELSALTTGTGRRLLSGCLEVATVFDDRLPLAVGGKECRDAPLSRVGSGGVGRGLEVYPHAADNSVGEVSFVGSAASRRVFPGLVCGRCRRLLQVGHVAGGRS